MARIESIRPGDALDSNFGAYPLPELLMGILRSNLTGLLEIHLHPTRKNFVYFRDGVPVAVSLPDVPGSVAECLHQRGEIEAATMARVVARAQESGVTESRVIEAERVVSDGALGEAIRICARAQVVALFGRSGCPFRFVEGMAMPAEAELVILQPLPVIYAGLSSADRGYAIAFAEQNRRRRFRLGETYPIGVDPFEWGPRIEAAVRVLEAPETIDALVERGVGADTAAAILASLHAADMLETHDPAPRGVTRNSASRSSQPPSHALPHDQIRAMLARRLDAVRGKSYFEVLRVPVESPPEVIDRAHRTLIARLDGGDDVGMGGLRAIFDEAHQMLIDPRAGPSYRAAVSRAQADPRALDERMRLEVGPKLERAIAALAGGRAGEAEYWLAWAADLDPDRKDLAMYRAMIAFAGAAPGARRDVAQVSRAAMEDAAKQVAPRDRAQLCLAILYAALRDAAAARRILQQAGNVGESLTEWAEGLLRERR